MKYLKFCNGGSRYRRPRNSTRQTLLIWPARILHEGSFESVPLVNKHQNFCPSHPPCVRRIRVKGRERVLMIELFWFDQKLWGPWLGATNFRAQTKEL